MKIQLSDSLEVDKLYIDEILMWEKTVGWQVTPGSFEKSYSFWNKAKRNKKKCKFHMVEIAYLIQKLTQWYIHEEMKVQLRLSPTCFNKLEGAFFFIFMFLISVLSKLEITQTDKCRMVMRANGEGLFGSSN